MHTEPKSYSTAAALEYKRYLAAMEEASDTIILNSISPCKDKDNTRHDDHLERSRGIHAVARIMSAMFWEDYIINGLGEMITLHNIDSNHKFKEKGPSQRSQFETYTASLRAMFSKTPKSYIMKMLLASFALEDVQQRCDVVLDHIHNLLRYADAVVDFMERYLTWLEHGAGLASSYVNALAQNDDSEMEPSDFYSDVRVKAYTILRVSDYDSTKLADYLGNVSALLTSVNELLSLGHKLYASMNPKAFENVFHALVSKKNRSPRYSGTKFENIHELNEYVRQRLHNSVEEPRGFMYNVNELLEETRINYLDKLATEMLETIAFLPDKKAQKLFVKQFESGKIWLKGNLGE